MGFSLVVGLKMALGGCSGAEKYAAPVINS